jgi:hypothetical protein
MNIPLRTLTAGFLVAFFGAASVTTAQVISQPTPAPLVTADMESWYLNGEPITYAGYTYYPAGAQVSFNSNEMARSGSHLGVPLYVRSTDEPYSLIYVPLARGFMQPYMRPRTGDAMQTAGTTAPAGAAAAFSPLGGTMPMSQAGGPPTMVAGPQADAYGQPRAPIPAISTPTAPGSVATGGAVAAQPPPVGEAGPQAAPAGPTHTRIGPRPQGINAVFIEFRDRRWYGEGQPVPLDRSRMIEVGELRGFPVYADRDEPEKRIYISTIIGSSIVAPYSGR